MMAYGRRTWYGSDLHIELIFILKFPLFTPQVPVLVSLRSLPRLTHLSWPYLPLPNNPQIQMPGSITEPYLAFTANLAGTCPMLRYVQVILREADYTFKILRDIGPQRDHVGDFGCIMLTEQEEEQEVDWDVRTTFWRKESERKLLQF